ncbi:MAG: ATP-binding cassette domain-containing protein, partial [Pseudomonadales bacterium]|nr:ATP-binding cassette domain-containing protein [Pseudomonadales bacterium]
MTTEPLLSLHDISAGYGGVDALQDVSLSLQQGEFIAIVGPNGAGKTTLFKTISGILTPSAGRIRFKDQDLLAIPAARRAHLGLAHVPEGRQVFPSLTIYENLELGAYNRLAREKWAENLEKIFSW